MTQRKRAWLVDNANAARIEEEEITLKRLADQVYPDNGSGDNGQFGVEEQEVRDTKFFSQPYADHNDTPQFLAEELEAQDAKLKGQESFDLPPYL